MLHQAKQYHLVEGIIVNSFMELEPGAKKALLAEEPVNRLLEHHFLGHQSKEPVKPKNKEK